MSKFLDNLANALDQQFSVGENTSRSLDDVVDGKTIRYAKLGDFADKFDKSAERRYLEEGYLRRDNYNSDPKVLKILNQQPDITVFVKKRMFSSLAENYRDEFMDSEEKLFVKASKVLFENKTKQIAAYEKLTKIDKLVGVNGRINDLLVPMIINLVDQSFAFGSGLGGGVSLGKNNIQGLLSPLKKITDRLKTIYAFNTENQYTTWIRDNLAMFQAVGDGTGVIELTNIASINTTTGLNINSGSCSFELNDPYEMCSISELDIEKAIADASNVAYNMKLFQLGKQSSQEILERNKQRLNALRISRGAGEISFKVNADTIYGRRVIAILDRLGKEIIFEYDSSFGGINSKVAVSEPFLRGGLEAGEEGLDTAKQKTPGGSSVRRLISDSELSLFSDIVKGIFEGIQLEKNSMRALGQNNEKNNYIRRKMRMHFLGKCIIQPMDVVHVYVNSRTSSDNKIMGGLKDNFNFINFSQKLANTFTNIENLSANFNPKQSIDFHIEKSVFVGDEFPNMLWTQMRNMFVKEEAGTHVFAGVVEGSSSSGSPASSRVSVSCKDNTAYFDMGVINFNPAADVFNGSFYNYLTPFKSTFDKTPYNRSQQQEELLDENKARLATGVIKHKAGDIVGSRATELNIVKDVFIDNNGRQSKVMYEPDGLVYRWKEGIGVLTQFGNSNNINSKERVGIQNIAANPFAGQDIMNVISLSITGEPYNYNTYYKAVSEMHGGLSNGQDSAKTFYESLTTDLARRNSMWGNFIPFKNLVVSPSQYSNTIRGIEQITGVNKQINETISKVYELKSKLSLVSDIVGQKERDDLITKLTSQAEQQIKEKQNLLNENIAIYGNDVELKFDSLLNNNLSKNYNSSQTARNIRRKTNFLTRRMSYMVRANQDKNLLIIDDSYDKDYDIIAFEKSIQGNLSLYKSDFKTVKQNISDVANLLKLEVFCDTQGNIRVRPPQYNKMPSSVFYRMMLMKNLNGIQIFPQFLNDLFLDQIETLAKRLEVCEDYIRLYSVLLYSVEYPDIDSKIENILSDNTKNSSSGSNGFRFVSNSNGDINLSQSKIDELNKLQTLEDLDRSDILNFSTLKNQNNVNQVFNPISAYKKLISSGGGISQPQISPENALTGETARALIDRLNTKNEKVNIKELGVDVELNSIDNSVILSTGKSNILNYNKIYQDILSKISERQKLIAILVKTTKNLIEAKALDNDPSSGNKALFPNLVGNKEIPETLEHLIQDESYDDFGPGSGSRYILSNDKIISYTIREQKPDFNTITVQGQFDPYLSNPPGFEYSQDGGGNALSSASAADYDSIRMYGTLPYGQVAVPFLKDPETQCAPYATTLLSIARKNILQGSVEIVGNEYMQPGDVVFLEQKGLLFYVETVNHNFSYSGSFTTSLTLTYGHAPGEYIPTYFDSVGKLFYKNRDTADLISHRSSNVNNEKNIGVIVADPSASDSSTGEEIRNKSLVKSNFAEHNNKIIEQILWKASYAINANISPNKKTKAKIELRTYRSFDLGTQNSQAAFKLSSTIADVLKSGVVQKDSNGKIIKNIPGLGNDVNIISYGEDAVVMLSSDSENNVSPSRAAWSMADDLSKKSSYVKFITSTDINSPLYNQQKVKFCLCGYIVDCWISFEDVDNSNNKK